MILDIWGPAATTNIAGPPQRIHGASRWKKLTVVYKLHSKSCCDELCSSIEMTQSCDGVVLDGGIPQK